MTCPWTQLYHMRLRAMRFGTYVESVASHNDGEGTIEVLTDGSHIILTLDPIAGTYELKRIIPESGLVLYSQNGTYEPEDEDDEYFPEWE